MARKKLSELNLSSLIQINDTIILQQIDGTKKFQLNQSIANACLTNQTGNSTLFLTTDGFHIGWGEATPPASIINDLTDVIISNPAAGQALKYNGSYWYNGTDNVGSGSSGNNLTVQYNDNNTFGSANNVTANNNDMVFADNPSPVPPGVESSKIFAQTNMGKTFPGYIDNNSNISMIQPHHLFKSVGEWCPAPNNDMTTFHNSLGLITKTGTQQTRTVALTNLATRSIRRGFTSTATAGSSAGMYTSMICTTGTGTVGGFFIRIRFCLSDNANNATAMRCFVGVQAAANQMNNIEYDTITNCIGVGKLSSMSNLSIIYGGGAMSPSIDLGANFPTNVATKDVYTLYLNAPTISNSAVYYRVVRENTGDMAEGYVTNFPASTTPLGVIAKVNNNTHTLSVGIDVMSVYFESEF